MLVVGGDDWRVAGMWLAVVVICVLGLVARCLVVLIGIVLDWAAETVVGELMGSF